MGVATRERKRPMSAVLAPQESNSMAEVVKRLGDIPLWRIRSCPPPGMATEQDVIDIRNRERRIFELVDGVLVEKPVAFMESAIAAVIITELSNHLRNTKAGIVTGEAGMMRLTTGLVRIPDVSVVLWDQIPGRKFPKEPIPSVAPDLAVEVLSESNTAAEMRRKLKEYFAAGCQCAWVIDPEKRDVKVYSSAIDHFTLGPDEPMSAPSVVPGFEITLTKILELAEIE